MEKGKIIIVSAPSGSGKSTIVNFLMNEHPEFRMKFSISATSRAPRGQEQHGVEYYFLSVEDFKARIANGEFLEYEEVYPGGFYGTLKAPVQEMLGQGYNVVFDVDVKGGVNLKKIFGDKAMSVFIQPPSVEELRRRLISRATDSEEAIRKRVGKAEEELAYAPQFDRILVNDDLNTAKADAVKLMQEFIG